MMSASHPFSGSILVLLSVLTRKRSFSLTFFAVLEGTFSLSLTVDVELGEECEGLCCLARLGRGLGIQPSFRVCDGCGLIVVE